jgi:hypothetical protein
VRSPRQDVSGRHERTLSSHGVATIRAEDGAP